MDAWLILGLMLQAVALWLVLRSTGRRWIANNGVLLVIVAVIFHGIGEVVQHLFPRLATFRNTLPLRSDLDGFATFVMGLGILVFAGVYVGARGRSTTSKETRVAIPGWTVIAGITALAYAAKISGRAFSEDDYWTSGLVDQFLLVGICISAYSLIQWAPQRLQYVALTPVALALGLLGSRMSVAIVLVTLLSLLVRNGGTLRTRTIVLGAVLLAFMSITISSGRATVGRSAMAEGSAEERVDGLREGAEAIGDSSSGILADFVYRIDGNAFPILILDRLDRGIAATGLDPLWNNFILAVPKILNPNKLRTPDEVRNEEFYMIQHFHLPIDVDYLPTTLGLVLCYFGVWGLIAGAILLGLGFALIDRWCERRPSPATVMVAVSLSVCALLFEQGVTIYFVTFRGTLALLVAMQMMSIFKRLRWGADDSGPLLGNRVGSSGQMRQS